MLSEKYVLLQDVARNCSVTKVQTGLLPKQSHVLFEDKLGTPKKDTLHMLLR